MRASVLTLNKRLLDGDTRTILAPSPHDTMKPSGRLCIALQIVFSETQDPQQSLNAPGWRRRQVCVSRIGPANVRAKRTPDSLRVILEGELILSRGLRFDARNRYFAERYQRTAVTSAPDHCRCQILPFWFGGRLSIDELPEALHVLLQRT